MYEVICFQATAIGSLLGRKACDVDELRLFRSVDCHAAAVMVIPRTSGIHGNAILEHDARGVKVAPEEHPHAQNGTYAANLS